MRMRTFLGGLVWLSACTAAPLEDSLELDDPEAMNEGLVVLAEVDPTPDRLPEPEPEPEPEETTTDASDGRARLKVVQTEDDWGNCEVEVIRIGFPAIHRGLGTVAYIADEPPGASDGPLPSWLRLDSVGAEHSESFDLEEGELFDDRQDPCPAYRARLRKRVRQYNETLRGYVPLQKLDVSTHEGWNETSAEIEQSIRALPPKDRPVRATYNGGHLVLRIPGVRSVAKIPHPSWWLDDEYCSKNPNVRAIYADRATGIAAVEVDHISGACLCDDGTWMHTTTLPSEVFEAIDARPTKIDAEDE